MKNQHIVLYNSSVFGDLSRRMHNNFGSDAKNEHVMV